MFGELLGLRCMCWRLARTWLDCCHHPGEPSLQAGHAAVQLQAQAAQQGCPVILTAFKACTAEHMHMPIDGRLSLKWDASSLKEAHPTETVLYASAGGDGGGTEALAEQRLRMLRAFRAAAAQLLDALLVHMLQELHGSSLVTALSELRVCHCAELCTCPLTQQLHALGKPGRD